jgi:hypothetical protein
MSNACAIVNIGHGLVTVKAGRPGEDAGPKAERPFNDETWYKLIIENVSAHRRK